jgi:hypothetical protein
MRNVSEPYRVAGWLIFSIIGSLMTVSASHAATAHGNFALQITPSPLVQTVKPGTNTSFPLQVRNNGTDVENLKVEVRHFTFDSTSGQASIADVAAPDLAHFVSFSASTFDVAPGQVFTDNVTLSFPADSGFSYSFVIVISRQSTPQATGGGQLLEGSIADFGLVNIDRPGAMRGYDISSIKTASPVYEYVPATLSITFKNTGNTFIQPSGTIFIGRGDPTKKPIATLPINDAKGYLLPSTSRTITSVWNDGFPRYDSETLSDGTVKKHEVWNIADLSKFRIGKYTARVVAVYNNGTYDVPVNAEVSFWVFPWKIVLGVFVIVLIIGFGLFTVIRSIVRRFSRRPRFGRR